MKTKFDTKGRLFLEEVPFDTVYKRKVGRGSQTCGRIYVPIELLGRNVYVVVLPTEIKK